MSNKLQNYFQFLEEKDNNDNDELVEIDRKEKSKPAPQPKKSSNQANNLVILYDCPDKFADEIRAKIKNKKQITLNNFKSIILKALCDALKNNTSVDTIIIPSNNYYSLARYYTDHIPSLVCLQQLLSISRIQFHVTTLNSSVYTMIFQEPSSVANISYLDVKWMTKSAPLDKLFEDLTKGTKLIDLRIERKLKKDQPYLNNLEKIGSFGTLTHLKITVFNSECKQLFNGLKNSSTITTLNLSESNIPAKFAPLLADLIAQNTSITSLNLKKCFVDDKCFSIICKGLLKNNTIQTLDISAINPFKQVDLSLVGGFENKKHLKVLKLTTFDNIIAKIFNADHLIMTDNNFEALKKTDTCQREDFAKISRLTLSLDKHAAPSELQAQQVKDLFEALNSNGHIMSLTIGKSVDSKEIINQLAANKTLKRVTLAQRTNGFFYQNFCYMIETNDTLEEFIFDGAIIFTDHVMRTHENLLKSLQKNKSLTSVGFSQLFGKLENFKELLTNNRFISFTNEANWPSDRVLLPHHQKIREEIVALNERTNKTQRREFGIRK